MAKKTGKETSILPYRPCAGVVLFRDDGSVFAGKRIDNPVDAWQMPQGGIDFGELPEEAALRELREETGVSSARVTVEAQSQDWLRYDLPDELLGKIWGGKFRGQEQMWFAMRFLGTDADVNIETDNAEFCEWRWMEPADLIESIVPFKRDLYIAVFKDFEAVLRA